MMTREAIWEAALKQSAIDCSCRETDFTLNRNIVTEAVPSDQARVYLDQPVLCHMVSYGTNVVATCRADLIPAIERYLSVEERAFKRFEAPAIFELSDIIREAGGMIFRQKNLYLPDPELVFGTTLSCGYRTREMHPADFKDLYLPEWRNALSMNRPELDMLGYGAYDGDRLIGLAGCSRDCADMWQIGIDVLPEYRRKGIASTLTNLLARGVFEREKIPFYGASWSNVRSVKNGLRSGFRPAWIEMTAEEAK